jgi:hypothetical protein
VGIGEVSWNTDPVIQEMWSLTVRQENHQQIELPAGYGTWSLGLAPGAKIGRLHRDLHLLVARLNSEGVSRFEIYGYWPRTAVADLARKLGIIYISRVEGADQPLAIFFMPHSGGAVPTDADGIVEWTDSVLGAPQYADVTQKLLDRSADERHVFLMNGSATPFGVQELLWRVKSALPTRTPAAPAGITHVWTATQFAPPAGVSIALWVANSGWSAIEMPTQSVSNP